MAFKLFEWKDKKKGSVTAYHKNKQTVYASFHTALLETRKK